MNASHFLWRVLANAFLAPNFSLLYITDLSFYNKFTQNDLPLLLASKWNIATAKSSSWGGFQNSEIWSTSTFFAFDSYNFKFYFLLWISILQNEILGKPLSFNLLCSKMKFVV